ncbi:MAG: thioredoxin family protein [Trueperaceae bacterium]|nr:thioredoxin family protein [Trueperaceae bacterium]
MLRDRVVSLATPEAVESFLADNPNSAIFKAGTCHKTMQGFGFVQEQLEAREDLKIGIIRVVEQRAASNLVAERTNIVHHSPQLILFKDGEAVFDLDNWSITPEALQVGFAKLPAGAASVSAGASDRTDLAPYLQVLDQYLSGVIDDRRFEYVYTTMFRDDASLRPRDEVEVLNSIFGDVDKHIQMHAMMAGRSQDTAVRERAERAYQALRAMSGQTPQHA